MILAVFGVIFISLSPMMMFILPMLAVLLRKTHDTQSRSTRGS